MVYNAGSVSDFQRGAWDVTPEEQNARSLLAEAERAASSGDLVLAEEFLKRALQLQEIALGSRHPDLANTLNNLAVLVEKTGQLDDAETLYRRAVAIASASLPADDPMVLSSRQNLEEFCRANGLPIDRPAATIQPTAGIQPTTPIKPTTRVEPVARVEATAIIEPAAVIAPARIQPASPAPAATRPSPTAAPSPPRASPMPSLALAAVAVAVLAAVAFFVARPRPTRQASAPVPAAQQASPKPADSSRPVPTVVAPAEPKAAPKGITGTAAISLVTVQVCRTFSASDFRCDPAGDSVPPGSIVLYTRVRSPRDDVIVHRWYRGETLRKSAQLRIGANGAEGYRTYSRQAVDSGDWRVEVRNAAGDLLHEQRFAVQ